MTPRIALLLVTLGLVLVPWLLWQIGAVRRWAPLAVLQIVVGVLLGPTGFGRIAPDWHRAIFTPALLGQLSGLATVGVLLYVLVAGLHLNVAGLRRDARRLAAPAIGSVAAPFVMGLAAGWWMAGHVAGAVGAAGSPIAFAVAVAICTSVTALPVLAAMLREMGYIATPLGQVALTIAAINDAALWLMIAVLLAASNSSTADGLVTVAAAGLWLAALVGLVRPALNQLARRLPSQAMLVTIIVAALASAAVSETIGLGYITGAFAAGLVVPAGLRPPLVAAIEPLTATVLLPFFFVVTGLRADIDPTSGVFTSVLIVSTAVTVIGKIAGTTLPARATGVPWVDALALGGLMQTKGLMEVIVLAIMADAGLIGPAVFSALVAMAILCTVAAAPFTRLVLARRPPLAAGAASLWL